MKWKILLRSRDIDGVSCDSPELMLWVQGRSSTYAAILFGVAGWR